MSKASDAHQIFNIVFFSVIVNALIPGAMVGRLANWLRVATNEPLAPPAILEISSGEILEAAKSSHSMLKLFRRSLIRGHTIIAPRGYTQIAAGDHIYLLCGPDDRPFVNLIFGRQESD
jgi:potassium/hydrogen antiporter